MNRLVKDQLVIELNVALATKNPRRPFERRGQPNCEDKVRCAALRVKLKSLMARAVDFF